MEHIKKVGAFDFNIEGKADYEILSDRIIIKTVPLAGEIVQDYLDGVAFKPLEEIKKIEISNNLVTFMHPRDKLTNGLVHLDRNSQSEKLEPNGFLTEPSYPGKFDDKLYADIIVFRSNKTVALESKLERGEGVDVSIGFKYEEDRTPGTFLGQAYDYIQRNIKLDHLAILIDEMGNTIRGRAPFPYYGIGADEGLKMDEKKFEKLAQDNAKLAVDFDNIKKENETLKLAADEATKKFTTLQTEKATSDEALGKANTRLEAIDKADKEAVDAMRTELSEKIPNMKNVFATADADSIKSTHKETFAKKATKLEGDANGSNSNVSEQEDMEASFRSTKQ